MLLAQINQRNAAVALRLCESLRNITGLANLNSDTVAILVEQKRVTPVMYSRGTIGEGDLMLTSNFLATMVGRGDA